MFWDPSHRNFVLVSIPSTPTIINISLYRRFQRPFTLSPLLASHICTAELKLLLTSTNYSKCPIIFFPWSMIIRISYFHHTVSITNLLKLNCLFPCVLSLLPLPAPPIEPTPSKTPMNLVACAWAGSIFGQSRTDLVICFCLKPGTLQTTPPSTAQCTVPIFGWLYLHFDFALFTQALQNCVTRALFCTFLGSPLTKIYIWF